MVCPLYNISINNKKYENCKPVMEVEKVTALSLIFPKVGDVLTTTMLDGTIIISTVTAIKKPQP